VNPSPAAINQVVSWAAVPSGGAGNYTYSWEGTDGLTGTTQSVAKTYSTIGTKYATTTITSGTESINIACPGTVAGGGGGGGDTGGGGVDVADNGVCNTAYTTGQMFYNLAPTSTLCTNGTFSYSDFGTGPWNWTCIGTGPGHVDPACQAQLNDLDPSLTCSLLMTPYVNPVLINTNTIWTSIATSTASRLWIITDSNGSSATTTETSGVLNKVFTTIGLKTVTARVASTTPGVYGAPCSATTTVVQTGGTTQEI
jgi:hypothetical protein